ncbi:MAG: 6-bladed beta-propeller [Thermodesulfobacteriota bacterium]
MLQKVNMPCPIRKRERGLSRLTRPLMLFLLLLSFSALMQGCSGSAQKEEQIAFEAPLIWPSPPSSARIGFEMTLEKSDDIGARKGLFKRISRLFLGESLERIIKPYGIAVDSSGRVIVADTALKAVHIFDLKKKKYRSLDRARRERFRSPIGVAVDGDDNIYVADSELDKVFVLNRKGRFLFSIEERLDRPAGIAIDKDERRLYVVNTWGHNVTVYDIVKGDFLFSIGERGKDEGEFNYPTNIFIDRRGDLYVADSLNYRVQIFGKDGKFLTMFGKQGDSSGDFARPRGVAVDRGGNIYVVEALFDTVQVFNRKGEYLLNFGSSGQGKGRFWLPSGLFIDDNDRIYIADSYNRRVQLFRYIGEDMAEVRNEN